MTASQSCIFCGSPAGSKEHIIADWIQELLDIRGLSVRFVYRSETQSELARARTFRNVVTHEVCRKCNNEWMSALDNDMTIFRDMIAADYLKTYQNFMEAALKGGTERLIKWMLKTAITSDSGSPTTNKFPPKIAQNLFAGNLPSGLFLNAGYITEPQVCGLFQPIIFRRGDPIPKSNKHDFAFSYTVQLKHLAFKLSRAPGLQPLEAMKNGRHPLPCFPVCCDPQNHDFRFESLGEFHSATIYS